VISPKLAVRAALIFIGCVIGVGAFGGLIGYMDSRTKQLSYDQERLRLLRESIKKGSSGDAGLVEAKELEAKIKSAADSGHAALRAREQGIAWASRAALVGLLPLGAWLFTQRLKSASAG